MAVLVSFLLVQIVASTALAASGVDFDVAGGLTLGLAASLGAIQVAGIAVLSALVAMGYVSWDRLAMRMPRGSLGAGLGALLPVGLLVLGPTMAVAVVGSGRVVDRDITPSLALAAVALALLIAINEELWFRGLLVDALQAARRPWLTVIGASVLFGLPHVGPTSAQLLNALGVTLAVGLPFTIVRLRFGSQAPIIVAHLIVNSWAFLHTASVTPQGSPSPGEIAGTLVAPTLVAAGYVWWYRRWLRAEPELTR